MRDTITEEVKQLIETPPDQLSDIQKLQIRFNSFVKKNYYVRWEIKNDNATDIRGSHIR